MSQDGGAGAGEVWRGNGGEGVCVEAGSGELCDGGRTGGAGGEYCGVAGEGCVLEREFGGAELCDYDGGCVEGLSGVEG